MFVLPGVFHMSTTIEFVCFKYKPLKNNEFPLRIRITKDRKTKYISLGVSVAPQYWDFDRNQPTLDCPDREYLEKLIANKLRTILKNAEKE